MKENDKIKYKWYVRPVGGYSKFPYTVVDMRGHDYLDKYSDGKYNPPKFMFYYWNLLVTSRDLARSFTKDINKIIVKNYKKSFKLVKSKKPVARYDVVLYNCFFDSEICLLGKGSYIEFDMKKIKDGFVNTACDRCMMFSTFKQAVWFLEQSQKEFDKIKENYGIIDNQITPKTTVVSSKQ